MDRFVPQVNACWRKCCTYPLCGGPPEELPLNPPTAGVLGWSWSTEDPVVIEPLPQIFTETAISEPSLSKRSDVATSAAAAANSFQLSPLKLVCTHSIQRYILGQKALRFSYVLVYLFPSCLVWGRDQVYSLLCMLLCQNGP